MLWMYHNTGHKCTVFLILVDIFPSVFVQSDESDPKGKETEWKWQYASLYGSGKAGSEDRAAEGQN